MRALAVDFGTSNTVAALGVDGGAPRLVTIDGSPLVPSSVFLTDDGTLAVGRDADRQARIDPSRYEPNPKRRIDDGTLLLGTQAIPVTTVIAEVLGRVTSEVRRQLGGNPDQVRLTHPARWGQRRKETLVTAARQAGLADDPVLVPEPVAAATHFATLSGSGLSAGQALAVYDLGGGTFDIAVVRRSGNGYEVLAEAGLPDLGGLDFDHAIVEHIGRTHAENVDAEAWRRLLMPTDAASRRLARALATDVRDGKEALSRYPHVDIALPPPFTDVHLTRTEYEDLIRPNLSRSIDLMRRTITEAGFEPTQLAGVYLVGGSSRIPLVARLIQEGLGVTPTTLDQPETSVVTGALYLGVGHAQPAAQGPVALPTGQVPVTRLSGFPKQAPPTHSGQSTTHGPAGVSPTGVSTGQQPAVGPRAALPGHQAAAGIASHLTGPPSDAQPAAPGSASGQQPAVPGPPGAGHPVADRLAGQPGQSRVGLPGRRQPVGLPPIRPIPFPPNQQRPSPTPGAAPGGGLLGPAEQPVTGGGGRGRILALAGGGLALVLVIVLVAVLVNRGGGGGRGGGQQTAADTKYDSYFTDAGLRDYLRPLYPQIKSCQRGVLGEAISGAATCTFNNGVQVTVGQADERLLPLDQFRQLISSTMEATENLTREEGSWSGGALDTFHGKDSTTTGAALYWDRKQGNIWGLAASDTMSSNDLRSWWQERFDR